jgi:hypothetical protein
MWHNHEEDWLGIKVFKVDLIIFEKYDLEYLQDIHLGHACSLVVSLISQSIEQHDNIIIYLYML